MTASQVFRLILALLIFAGIWLTGFDKVHWLLYLAVFILFVAGVTDRCAGIWLLRKMGLK
jgi:hypothetical protein